MSEGTEADSDPQFRPEDMRADLAAYLEDLSQYRMPFGKYRNRYLYDLPLEYLQWFQQKDGFPSGRLGELMSFVCSTKTDGAEIIFGRLREARKRRRKFRD